LHTERHSIDHRHFDTSFKKKTALEGGEVFTFKDAIASFESGLTRSGKRIVQIIDYIILFRPPTGRGLLRRAARNLARRLVSLGFS